MACYKPGSMDDQQEYAESPAECLDETSSESGSDEGEELFYTTHSLSRDVTADDNSKKWSQTTSSWTHGSFLDESMSKEASRSQDQYYSSWIYNPGSPYNCVPDSLPHPGAGDGRVMYLLSPGHSSDQDLEAPVYIKDTLAYSTPLIRRKGAIEFHGSGECKVSKTNFAQVPGAGYPDLIRTRNQSI